MIITCKDIRDFERRTNEMHKRINQTVLHRDEGPAQRREWEQACAEWHSYDTPVWELWSREVRDAIVQNKGKCRESAITFLEEDPWCFRSGYLKERVIRALKQTTLTDSEASRIQEVLLRIVDSRHRREFRDFCRLARKVADSSLISKLQSRLASPNIGIRLRSSWMLDYVR